MADYRSQETVEADFRQMKDPKAVSFSPMFHFTDQKIRVHAFYCVLALSVTRVMVRHADAANLHMSVRETARHPGGDRRNGTALPRRTGPGPGPGDAHRDDRHPKTPPRPLRPRRLRPDPMTASAARPPAWDTLETALRQRRAVQLSYHGRPRTICPHALGWKNNKARLLAYQTAPQNPSGDPRKPMAQPLRRRHRRRRLHRYRYTWETADNYNDAHPFNAIDELAVAITNNGPYSTV